MMASHKGTIKYSFVPSKIPNVLFVTNFPVLNRTFKVFKMQYTQLNCNLEAPSVHFKHVDTAVFPMSMLCVSDSFSFGLCSRVCLCVFFFVKETRLTLISLHASGLHSRIRCGNGRTTASGKGPVQTFKENQSSRTVSGISC